MAVNKSQTRKIKRRLAYIYFPALFAVIGILVVRLLFAAIVPNYKDYRLMAFGEAPTFTEQLERKSFVAFEGEQGESFNNVSTTLPVFNQQYAELKCEALEIEAPVFWGDTDLILRSGVGTYSASSVPGYGGNILMSAHNTTFFEGLKNAKEGDVFTLTTTYARFEYKVNAVKVLDFNDASAVNYNAEDETLVLYTCYPFQPLAGVSNQRLFVYCQKVSGPSAKNVEVDL
ncbi:MAG: class D sortase [Clostridia bacterium]|nr:class D sortase [Clostridia bacterium]